MKSGRTCIPASRHFLMTLIVGSTAFNPFGWFMHFESRKKFCISTITKAVDSGAILIEVPPGPSVVGIVNLIPDPPLALVERS